jgi:L-rhamnose isomerase
MRFEESCLAWGLRIFNRIAVSLGYAIVRKILLCLDAGHFIQPKQYPIKISSVLTFMTKLSCMLKGAGTAIRRHHNDDLLAIT